VSSASYAFTSLLVTAFNGEYPRSSRFQKVPPSQVRASQSSNSQGLNRNSPLTHSPANSLTELHKSKLKLRRFRRLVSQSVLMSAICLGPMRRLLLLSDSCGFVDLTATSLTKGRVCRLQSLLDYASAVILWSEFLSTQRPYFSVPDSGLPKPGGPGTRIYNPQENGDPVIPPDTGVFSTQPLNSV
jgi:hypothetical protein